MSGQGAILSKRFEGKVALVTGGASGIGRATAIRLVSQDLEDVLARMDEIVEQDLLTLRIRPIG